MKLCSVQKFGHALNQTTRQAYTYQLRLELDPAPAPVPAPATLPVLLRLNGGMPGTVAPENAQEGGPDATLDAMLGGGAVAFLDADADADAGGDLDRDRDFDGDGDRDPNGDLDRDCCNTKGEDLPDGGDAECDRDRTGDRDGEGEGDRLRMDGATDGVVYTGGMPATDGTRGGALDNGAREGGAVCAADSLLDCSFASNAPVKSWILRMSSTTDAANIIIIEWQETVLLLVLEWNYCILACKRMYASHASHDGQVGGRVVPGINGGCGEPRKREPRAGQYRHGGLHCAGIWRRTGRKHGGWSGFDARFGGRIRRSLRRSCRKCHRRTRSSSGGSGGSYGSGGTHTPHRNVFATRKGIRLA